MKDRLDKFLIAVWLVALALALAGLVYTLRYLAAVGSYYRVLQYGE
jgi:hypothetical protein